jgi:very-short-patch-repair endonuclease
MKNSTNYTKSNITKARHLRHMATPPEKKMWYECLSILPVHFRRQRPFGNYIVDFYAASLKLVIELDGESHNSPMAQQYDANRTLYLQSLGLEVIRFSNHEVMHNIEGVFETIKQIITDKNTPLNPPCKQEGLEES